MCRASVGRRFREDKAVCRDTNARPTQTRYLSARRDELRNYKRAPRILRAPYVHSLSQLMRAPPNDTDRELLALPARLGGLGIVNPTKLSPSEHQASMHQHLRTTEGPHSRTEPWHPFECLETQINAKRDVHKQNRDKAIASAATLRVTIPKSRQCAMDLAQERGASSWLTILPLEEFGLMITLHKGAFRDAIALRYGW